MSAKMLFPNSGPIHIFWGLGGRRIFCGDTIPIHVVIFHHMEDIRMQLKVGEDLRDIVVQVALTFFAKPSAQSRGYKQQVGFKTNQVIAST